LKAKTKTPQLRQALCKLGSKELNTSDSSTIKLEKSIRSLTKAVWVVAFVLIINFVLSIFPWVFPDFYLSRFTEANLKSLSSEKFPQNDQRIIKHTEVSFHDLALEEQIKKSSAIVFAKYQRSDDGRVLAIVDKYLKSPPASEKFLEVGEEHQASSYYPKEKHSRGDGVIILFTGSPATVKMTVSVYDDRVPGYGDITLQMLEDKIRETE
jgi:hypothetical protein